MLILETAGGEITSFVTLVKEAGANVVLAGVVFALLRGWLVTKREFERERQRGDEWKDIALQGQGMTGRAIDVLHKSGA